MKVSRELAQLMSALRICQKVLNHLKSAFENEKMKAKRFATFVYAREEDSRGCLTGSVTNELQKLEDLIQINEDQ